MVSVPRIITVDPTGSIAQQIGAATDLMDRFVTRIDVPSAAYALEEMQRGGVNAVIAAWEPGDGMKGWELAAKLKQIDAEVAVILLGDYEDAELDEQTLEQSPFVYLKRPFDIPQFIRVFQAALDGKDLREALRQPITAAAAATTETDMGSVPDIDEERAAVIMQALMTDLTPTAALLSTREGRLVVARGASDYLDVDMILMRARDAVLSNIHLRDTIGSNAQAFIFYDGDENDIFVISVGLHHFLSIVFPGEEGARQLGAVSRFGRRHAEDLIGVLGANAWIMQRAMVVEEPEEEIVRKSKVRRATQEIEAVPELVRANISGSTSENEVVEDAEPESVMPQLEAIADDEFDPDALFSDDFNEAEAENLFSMDAMEELAADEGKKGTVDWERAIELGILDE